MTDARYMTGEKMQVNIVNVIAAVFLFVLGAWIASKVKRD